MKPILSILIFLSAFSDFFVHSFNLPLLNYCDEILLIISLGYIVKEKALSNQRNGYLNFIIFGILLFSVLSFVFGQKTNSSLIILQVIIHFKLFIITYLITQVFDKKWIIKLLKFMFVFLFFGMFVNVLLGENFNEIYDIKIDYRFGLFSINGFQMNRNALGLALILLYLILNDFNKLSKPVVFATIVIAIFITGSRTAIILFLLAYFYLNILFKYKKLRVIILFFLITIIIPGLYYSLENSEFFLITKNNFSQINNESGYIRGIIIYFSFVLSSLYFPFGSGAATFATIMSKDSEVYSMIGLDNSIFIQEFHGIFDSNFASILGEFGYLGIVFFIILFIKLKSFLNVHKSAKIPTIIIILVLSVYSFTTPIFMSANFIIFTSLTFAYFYNSNQNPSKV